MLVSVGEMDGWPVGGVDYPRTFQEFRQWFPDDAACAAYLANLRWPEGFQCPVCGGDRAWQTSTQHWKCVACGRKTSVTAGTIFHPHSHAAEHVVCRDLASHLAEERGLGAESARHVGAGLLRDGVG